MEIVLASNFDERLVAETQALPVSTFFGNYPTSLTGGGRPPRILPKVTERAFAGHVADVHAAGRRFYATLNSIDLGLKEYRPRFREEFLGEVDHLLDVGVDGFVLALPVLIELVHREHPGVPITVSTFARVRTVTQAEYFARLGADTVVLEEANRDFALVRALVRLGLRVEVLVNQTCLKDCPYRAHHLNTSSIAAQTGSECPVFEYPILECGSEMVRDPSRIISGIFVRPEDLPVYEEAGVTRFKVSGRNRSTAWLARAARAYAERRYDGNLLDILSFVQVKGPTSALRQLGAGDGVSPVLDRLYAAFEGASDLRIENSAFPPGFLRRIAATDCVHTTCAQCGYCPGVARRVLSTGGRPLDPRSAAVDLPSPVEALGRIGLEPSD
ncbi:MAG: U32 family peptidase [Thermoplasmata archaeon]